ncbi:MAG: lactate utilization protein [Synergistaceae bacterium]|jgi:hypothetical protein|nr:lactate utilization protein [Synergistaceae bacterium]
MGDFGSFTREVRETLGKKICAAFLSNGYKSAVYAPLAADAAKLALDMIPEGASVGIPGSVTVRQIGLIEGLEAKKCVVYQHWGPKLAAEDKLERLKSENASDWFVTSSNAITYDGKMINIDGTGNRLAAMSWGTGSILYIVSINKAMPDLTSALARARDISTPANALRVGSQTPCVKIGHCTDCKSPDRLCRAVLILERPTFGRNTHVIIVGQDLGY